MKLSELFPKKSAPKKDRGGLSKAQADAIEKEFIEAFSPVAAKATQYFVAPCINGKQRFWLLPGAEQYSDLSIEKMQYVLRYKTWFLTEVEKEIIDDLSYDTNPTHAPLQR